MTDIKLGETDGPAGEGRVAELIVDPWSDWAARAAIVIVFTAFAIVGLAGIPRHLPVDSIHRLLLVAASIANVMFVTLVAWTTLTRLTPVQKARGSSRGYRLCSARFCAYRLLIFQRQN